MISHRSVTANGIDQHIAESGQGPLVLLLHGFPESWYSWRHQLDALAAAGYHAVAPDMRGYGGTDAPAEIASYSLLHLAGDVIALAAELGAGRFALVGHDWGAPVAAQVGVFRPDLVRGVALLSVPYSPRGAVDTLTAVTAALGADNYQAFFQEPGVAEALLDRDVRASVRSVLLGWSGEAAPGGGATGDARPLTRFDADTLRRYDGAPLPDWLTEADVDQFAADLGAHGFRGGLNWYRTSRRNWELLAPWHHAPLVVPSLYLGGQRDGVVNWPGMRERIATLAGRSMPGLTHAELLDGAGHWLQQERPDEVNHRLLQFLAGLAD